MHRVPGAAKIIGALGCAGLMVAATAPAIASATEPAPILSTSALATPPIASATAANRAGDVYEESASTTGARVPIVTVETTSNGPKIVAHQVTSESQARAVATTAAVGNDLVAVQHDAIVSALDQPPTNDSYSRNQWSLNPAKTTFTNAWSTTTGTGITVAVIDTGVAADHPDLAGQVLPGRAFLNGASSIGVALNPSTDTCGHGTHVAGTIAALANNFLGVAGVAPGVKILPVKVLDCSGYTSDVANGIKWAANNGARVINLSLGGPGGDAALQAAISYARSKKVVVVAAAGNNQYHKTCNPGGNNATSYPGASPGVIGVAAMDEHFSRACFSNVGSYVDLAAPGTNVLSTYPPALTQDGDPPYMYMSGTSMATPHVAAAAALVLARRPGCNPDRVERRLETTARKLGRYRRDTSFGYGLVDPARAIRGKTC